MPLASPAPIRRVVIGAQNGKPVILSDERSVREFDNLPGFSNTLMWTTPAQPQVGQPALAADPVPAVTTFVPPVGETRFMIVTFPPDASMGDPGFNGEAFGKELAEKMPGLAELFEPEDPAMHVTDSVDYGVVLDGEVWLDLGAGEEVHLKRHDVVIQNGARHGWRNKSAGIATMLFVLIGAQRQPA